MFFSGPRRQYFFTGSFSRDEDVQLFQLTVLNPSTVTVRTLSYAGGINAAGMLIPAGGFDTYLALFDSQGRLLDQSDDQPDIGSALAGLQFDATIQQALSAGSYTIALSQFDSFAIGPTLSNGFLNHGTTNFTKDFGCSNGSFCDFLGNNRTPYWAVDFLNVTSASEANNAVPEPSSWLLIGLGLTGISIRLGQLYKQRCPVDKEMP